MFKPTLRAAFIINRRIANTALGRDVSEALASYPVPVLKTVVGQRIVLAESAAQGQTVFETAPRHAAAKELQRLAEEITEFSR